MGWFHDKYGKDAEMMNAIIPEPNLSVITVKEKADSASPSQAATASSAETEKLYARADITAKWEKKFGRQGLTRREAERLVGITRTTFALAHTDSHVH